MVQRTRQLNAVAILATLMGCAGNGEGLDQNGKPLTPTSASNVLTADFNSIQEHVFTPICSVCHAGANAPRGLRLDAGNSYALLVGVNSSQVPGLQRVQAGNPDASYLLQKITGAAAAGQRMPLGGPYLPQATVDVIRQWIATGAQRPVSITTSSLRVATTSPLPDEAVTALTQIVIGFNRELDTNLINTTTVLMEKVLMEKAPIEKADTAEAVAVQMTVPAANTSTLLITPYAALAAGTYRLTLRGVGGGALAGLDTQPLNASELSADGQNFSTLFTIKGQP